MHKLIDNIFAIRNSLLYKDTLVIGDLHIGFEQEGHVALPNFQYKKIEQELIDILNIISKAKKKVKKIIILGDIRHQFQRTSFMENKESEKFISFLKEHFKELILIRGNHDTILTYQIKENFKVHDYLIIDKILFCHGHKQLEEYSPKEEFKTIIIGHEHPALTLREGVDFETYKCFLVGKYSDDKYKNKTLIAIPSFNFVSYGTDILKSDILSPILKKVNLSKFKVFVPVEDKVLDFGYLKYLED